MNKGKSGESSRENSDDELFVDALNLLNKVRETDTIPPYVRSILESARSRMTTFLDSEALGEEFNKDARLVDEFIESSFDSESTKSAYGNAIRKLKTWCHENNIPMSFVSHGEVMEFLFGLTETYRTSTVQQVVAATRCYFDWLIVEGHVSSQPLVQPRMMSTLLDKGSEEKGFLTFDEVTNLFKSFNCSKNIGRRNKAMAGLMFYCFLTPKTIPDLLVSDLVKDGNQMSIKILIGGEEVHVPLSTKAEEYINEYLASAPQGGDKDAIMFPNFQGGSMSRISVFNAMQKAGERAGINTNVNPSIIRLTGIMALFKSGASLDTVDELTGYRDPAIVGRYRTLSKSADSDLGKLLDSEGVDSLLKLVDRTGLFD